MAALPSPRTALVVALVLLAPGAKGVQAPRGTPAERVLLPAALASRLGDDVPEVVWIGLHPKRDDGAWVLLGNGWTLVTGFPADARAEVKAARKLPSTTPPVPPPDVGVKLHVVRMLRAVHGAVPPSP
jgi:hypothetical protein